MDDSLLYQLYGIKINLPHRGRVSGRMSGSSINLQTYRGTT